ncbi:MAG: hypothetical protein HY779_05270 [Rubrobacteridae bacterium]|nr:hypothetical protein [Rubrobacteridae bacterium]
MGDDNLMDDVNNGAPDKAPEKVIPPKKNPARKSGGGSKSSKKASSNKQGFQIPEQIDIIWTIALIVAAFVIGFFAHGWFEAPKIDDTLSPMMQTTPGDLSSSESQGGGGMNAPALEESQLNGGMPSGHPNIDDSGNAVDEKSSNGAKSDVPAAGSTDSKSVEVEKDPDSSKK